MNALLSLVSAAALFAQQDKPKTVGPFNVAGSIRTRVEMWDWFPADPAVADGSYGLSGNLTRLTLSKSYDTWDWQAELAIPFLLGLPGRAIAPGAQGQLGAGGSYFAANDGRQNVAMPFLKQAFVRFKLGRIKGGSQQLRLGRFEYVDGSELTPNNPTLSAIKRDRVNMRLIGHFGWTHVGRSFDGLHYTLTKPGGNFTFVGAIPTRGVFQVDGWGQTNTAFGYGAYTRPWKQGRHEAETRFLALYYQDWRRILKADSRPLTIRRGDLANIRIFTFGGHSVHAWQTQQAVFDVLLWGVGQTGTWGALNHRAHALSLEAGFQPNAAKRLKPWIRGGFSDGSGDGDPNDRTHATFFQVLPTPRPFAKFPFFNMMNNRDAFGMLILRPHAKITVTPEFHALHLSNSRDLWYSGGGVFQPWTFGYAGRAAVGGAKSLASLYDFSLEWRARKDVTIAGYLGHATGGDVVKSIYPRGSGGTLAYIEVMWRL